MLLSVGTNVTGTGMIRRVLVEFVGSCLLVAAVVGSGILATQLTGDLGIQLFINAVSTVLVLGVLIYLFLPTSGAHFNPVVTLAACAQRKISIQLSSFYLVAQILGAICGATLANLMFSLPAWSVATQMRSGGGLFLGEVVATAGLVAIIFTLVRTQRTNAIAILVPAWIGAAYFFTSSTSFANPAVTIGRMFSDTFAGIAPSSVPPFIVAQLIGATLGTIFTVLFFAPTSRSDEPITTPTPKDLS